MAGECNDVTNFGSFPVDTGVFSQIQTAAEDVVTATENALRGLSNIKIDEFTPFGSEVNFEGTPAVNTNGPYREPDEVEPINLPIFISSASMGGLIGNLGALDTATAPPAITTPSVFVGAEPSAPNDFTANAPTPPDLLDPPTPPDAPTITEPDIPESPELAFPDPPDVEDLQLPDVVSVDFDALLAQFNALRDSKPVADPSLADQLALDASGEFANQYTSNKARSDAFLAENPVSGTFFSRLADLLAGGTGLTATIEQQLFDRAVVREDRNTELERQNILTDWSSRGFTLPGGVATARLQTLYQARQNARQQINRDIYVQNAQFEIENLRFAVQQGLELESLFRRHFVELCQVSVATLEQIVRISVAVFEARIALFRAQVEAYTADVAAFRQALEIELGRIAAYRAQVDAQRAVAEIQSVRVQAYRAHIEGLLGRVQVYRTQIEAVNAQIRTVQARVDAYRANVEAFRALIESNRARVDVYDSQVRAELGRTQGYEALVRSYGTRVEAFRTSTGARIDVARLGVESDRSRVELFSAQVAKYRADIDKAIGAYQTQISRLQALIERDRNRVQNASNHSDSALAQRRMHLEAAITGAQQRLGKAQLEVSEARNQAELNVTTSQAIAQVLGQLAAAYLSALNVSQSFNASQSRADSTSCNTSYSASVGA